MKLALIGLIGIIGLLGLLELGLRWLIGFGNPPLYMSDEQIGYLLAPHQTVKRFGNRIAINAYSMRSPDIAPTRPEQTWRILLLGDSVVNGNWWTDQAAILSALLEQQPQLQQLGLTIEVLNASANSWGPRNELAYVQRFGTFEAQAVLLLINTDDLFATAPTPVQVGRDPMYPNRKPPLALALAEVYSRYVAKPQPIPELEAVRAEGGDRVGANLEAIQQLQALTQAANGQLLLAMTPLLRETGQPGPRDYELKARQRLQDLGQAQGIPYLDFLPLFNQTEPAQSLYRDHIHLSPTGNQLVVQGLSDLLQRHFSYDKP